MKKIDLPRQLEKLGLDVKRLSLSGELIDDCFHFVEGYGRWTVFHLKNGQRQFEKSFFDESEACRYLMHLAENSQPDL